MLQLYLKIISNSKKKSQGFTLIELLVVIIIAGILAAFSYPLFFSTIGKARETEAKLVLSSIGQAQQTYFWENGTFATQLNELNVRFQEGYYQFQPPNILNTIAVGQKAIPVNSERNNTREYELGIYYNSGAFRLTMCQSLTSSSSAEVPGSFGTPCVQGREIY